MLQLRCTGNSKQKSLEAKTENISGEKAGVLYKNNGY